MQACNYSAIKDFNICRRANVHICNIPCRRYFVPIPLTITYLIQKQTCIISTFYPLTTVPTYIPIFFTWGCGGSYGYVGSYGDVVARMGMWWLIGSAPDCHSAVPGSNPASLNIQEPRGFSWQLQVGLLGAARHKK